MCLLRKVHLTIYELFLLFPPNNSNMSLNSKFQKIEGKRRTCQVTPQGYTEENPDYGNLSRTNYLVSFTKKLTRGKGWNELIDQKRLKIHGKQLQCMNFVWTLTWTILKNNYDTTEEIWTFWIQDDNEELMGGF